MNIGGFELLVIFIIILLAFGPKRMPEIARFIAGIVRECRKAIDEIKHEISGGDDFMG